MTPERPLHSPDLLKWYKQNDERNLIKMYPDEDWQNQYILFLQFDLYWPYDYDNITAEIGITTGKVFDKPTGNTLFDELHGSYCVPPSKIRNPYPNRGWKSVCMKNGRKLSDLGMPILFPDFDELQEVCVLSCRWKVECDDFIYDCRITRYITIEDSTDAQYRVYGIRSQELPLFYLYGTRGKTQRTHLLNYANFGRLTIAEDGSVNTSQYWNAGTDCKQIRPGAYEICDGTGLPDICTTQAGKRYEYEVFYGNDTLTASDCSHMIMHV